MDKAVQAQFAPILMESKLCEEEPKTVIYDDSDVEDFVSHRMRFIQVLVGVVFDMISPTANLVNQTTCQ